MYVTVAFDYKVIIVICELRCYLLAIGNRYANL